MARSHIPSRPPRALSHSGTARTPNRSGGSSVVRGIMVNMSIPIVLALFMIPDGVGARGAGPRLSAVAVARAQVVSGVRNLQEANEARPARRTDPTPRPRERPCPEAARTPCRLFVTDLP